MAALSPETLAGIRRRLLRAVQWLAADAEATIAAAPGAAVADELALDLEHWLMLARQEAMLGPTVEAAIGALDAEFRRGDRADLWTDEAIRTSPEWATQRKRARVALALMGADRADDELRGNA